MKHEHGKQEAFGRRNVRGRETRAQQCEAQRVAQIKERDAGARHEAEFPCIPRPSRRRPRIAPARGRMYQHKECHKQLFDIPIELLYADGAGYLTSDTDSFAIGRLFPEKIYRCRLFPGV